MQLNLGPCFLEGNQSSRAPEQNGMKPQPDPDVFVVQAGV